MRNSFFLLVAVAALLPVLDGCRSDDSGPMGPAEPDDAEMTVGAADQMLPKGSSPQGFLPLDVGNTWTYEHTFDYVVVDDQGNVIGTGSSRDDVVHEIIGTEERFGREYVLNQQTYIRGVGEDFHWWDRYRQDRSGLYRANIGLGEPPMAPNTVVQRAGTGRGVLPLPRKLPWIKSVHADPTTLRAYETAWDRLLKKRLIVEEMRRGAVLGPPGGVLSGESTTLRYPLRAGQTWVNRDSPFLVTSEVEAMEILDLPAGRMAAWRVRLDNSLLGPNDSVLFWFGRTGRLAERIQVESVATDENGNPIGRLLSDEALTLQSLRLVHPGP